MEARLIGELLKWSISFMRQSERSWLRLLRNEDRKSYRIVDNEVKVRQSCRSLATLTHIHKQISKKTKMWVRFWRMPHHPKNPWSTSTLLRERVSDCSKRPLQLQLSRLLHRSQDALFLLSYLMCVFERKSSKNQWKTGTSILCYQVIDRCWLETRKLLSHFKFDPKSTHIKCSIIVKTTRNFKLSDMKKSFENRESSNKKSKKRQKKNENVRPRGKSFMIKSTKSKRKKRKRSLKKLSKIESITTFNY